MVPYDKAGPGLPSNAPPHANERFGLRQCGTIGSTLSMGKALPIGAGHGFKIR